MFVFDLGCGEWELALGFLRRFGVGFGVVEAGARGASRVRWEGRGRDELSLYSRVKQTYSDLKIDNFIGDGAHLIIEAEAVFADFVSREDKVALSLFVAFHDPFLVRAVDAVVDVEGAAGLDL